MLHNSQQYFLAVFVSRFRLFLSILDEWKNAY